MMECHYTHPALWLSQLDNTQFIMNTSGYMAMWCGPSLSMQSIHAQWQTKSSFLDGELLFTKDGRDLLQNSKGQVFLQQ